MTYTLKIDKEFLKQLLQQDLSNYNSGPDLVIQAIQNNDLDLVADLIDETNNQNYLDLACVMQNIDLVALLLSKGADPNKKGGYYYPIVIATKKSNLDILKLLINHGALNGLERSIEIAGEDGNKEIMKYLLEHASLYIRKKAFTYLFFIYLGIHHNIYELLELFFEQDRDALINITDSKGDTLLHRYAKQTNLSMIKFLLEHGADYSIRNNKGLTARQLAEEELKGRFYREAEKVIALFEQYEIPVKCAVHE